MFKTKEEVIVIQAEAKEPIPTRAVFWSHDKGTAKMLFKLRKDGTSQALAEGTIVPVLLKFNSGTAEGGVGRHIYHATIEDAVNGIVSIVLEDNILGYVGRVEGSIYIELPDSRSLDTAGRFTFQIKRSPIDEDVPELEDYYWQGFNEIMNQYHGTIATIKFEAKTLLDSLSADVTKVKNDIATANTRIEEINKKIDDNDVFTKAESSANVIDNIAGTETATLKKELLVNGTEATGARDDNGTLIPFAQDDYDKIAGADTYVRSETLISGRGAEIQFDFNVIGTLESKYPALFKGLTTVAEKIAKYKAIVKGCTLSSTLQGGGLNSSNANAMRYARAYMFKANSSTILGLGLSNSSSTMQDISVDIMKPVSGYNFWEQVQQDGQYYFKIVSKVNSSSISDVGALSDGVTPAWVEVKDIKLTVELEVNGRTIIESMIAANHVENLATLEEAEAGTDTTKTMTPLRVAEYVDEKAVTIAGNQTVGGIKNFKDGVLLDDVPVFGITRNVVFNDAEVGGYFNAVDKISLGAVGKIDKVVLVWSRVDDSAGTLLNYSWSQTVLFPDDIILGNSYRVQLTSENYKFITFKNESGILTISGSNENSVAPNRIYRIKRIVAYIKK